MAEITIHFVGICTHLVNGSRQPGNPPQDIQLRGIHDWHPQLRVVLPSSDNLLPTRGCPRHFPLLRYKAGDVKAPAQWMPKRAKDGYWEVDLQGAKIWFSDVVDNVTVTPPAQALHSLPSIWARTKDGPSRTLDMSAANEFNSDKVAAYVDFFGGQSFVIHNDPSFPNQVMATFQLRDGQKPLLMWNGAGGMRLQAEIRPAATIQISNAAPRDAPCCTDDYLLHYRVTQF